MNKPSANLRLFFFALAAASAPSLALSESASGNGLLSFTDKLSAAVFGLSPEEENFLSGVELYKAGKAEEALPKFQMAATSKDRSLKARALHNSAMIQIDKQQLVPARALLRDALSYDNDSLEIKENLAWVEEQIEKMDPKDDPSKKDQPNPSEEKTAEEKEAEQKDAQQKSAEQKQDGNEKKSAEEKQGQEKSAEQNDKGQEQQAGEKSAEQKMAEKKEALKEDKAGEEKTGKDAESQTAENEKKSAEKKEEALESKPSPDKNASENPDEKKSAVNLQEPRPGESQEQQMLLTPAEIKQQEAERLLRTIDDRIGRYPLTDTEATSKRGNNGKNW